MQPVPGANIDPSVIKRSYPYEALEQWALSSPENLKTFCKFQAYIYPFIYELVKSGGVAKFLWRWPVRGIPWALKVKWVEMSFRKKTGITLVSQETINQIESEIGLSE